MKEEDESGWLISSKKGSFTRRQDCPKVYEMNGAIYIINTKALKKIKSLSEFTFVKKYLMDEISSHDIDSSLDWKIAEVIVNDRFTNI
jgi:N-acylneuraminate cytidylyltransferase